ncbi:hypothetical protein ASD24_01990 [Paenibacillus sp. Root52]|uniref:IclR family transcriptional regulator n=1 Tax=Paenibacillus sp. Root52 TaxID=1736552 RepID=UPI0006FE8050|nr:IclR family transcriptional regulator [Paenibacillus sp. Root52]KQY94354.1 hypothetical protein ASD24_01990 [Paenibacillus sp. Root52]
MTNKSNVTLKTLTIMKAFIDQQAVWGVNDLARYLNSPPSSIHRILKTLREENILHIIPETNKYTIGNEWVRLSSFISANFGLKSVAEPYLKKLSQDVGQSVYLAQYQEQYRKLSFILGIHSSNILQYRLELGVLQPIHIGASGKAILAFLSDEKIGEVLEQEEVQPTDVQHIWSDVEKIRSVGFSYTFSERKNESIGFGAPIFDATNQVVGSIICAIPLSLYKEENKQGTIDKILETAREISYHLGLNHPSGAAKQDK